MNYTSNSSNNQTPNYTIATATVTEEISNSLTRVVTEESTIPQQNAPSIGGIYRTITSESYQSTVIDFSQESIESFGSQQSIISFQNDINIISYETNFTHNEEVTITRQNAIHPLPSTSFNYNSHDDYTS